MPIKYLNPTGTDSPDSGSSSQPFQTFEYAVKQLNNGDVLKIQEGSYHTLSSPDESGAYKSLVYLSNLSNITIEAEEGAQVIIDGSLPHLSRADEWVETTSISGPEPLIRRRGFYRTKQPVKIKNFYMMESGIGASMYYQSSWLALNNYLYCPDSLADYFEFRRYPLDAFLSAAGDLSIDEFINILSQDLLAKHLDNRGISMAQFLANAGLSTADDWTKEQAKILRAHEHYVRLQFMKASFFTDEKYAVKPEYAVDIRDKQKFQPYYVGPGVFYDLYTSHIYLRLDPASEETVGTFHAAKAGLPVARNLFDDLSLDDLSKPSSPGRLHLSVGIFVNGGAGRFPVQNWNNVTFRGIHFLNHFSFVFRFGTEDSSKVRFVNCSFSGKKAMLIARMEECVIDHCIFDGQIPPWIAWGDVKNGYAVGSSNDAQMIRFASGGPDDWNDKSKFNRVTNCVFKRCMDGILVGSDAACNTGRETRGLIIKNNHFDRVLDDAVLIGASSHHIEVAHNHFDEVGSGVAYMGSGCRVPPESAIGMIFIHHNLIVCAPIFGSRRLKEELDVEHYVIQPLTTTHGSIGRSPRKIYNNTIIIKGTYEEATIRNLEPNIGKLMPVYQGIRSLDDDFPAPSQRHEVFNNILIYEEADLRVGGGSLTLRVEDGYEVFDGNIYSRVRPTDKDLFNVVLYNSNPPRHHYKTLKAFTKTKPENFIKTQAYYSPGWENSGYEGNPGLNKNYHPKPGSEAAKPGVDLSLLPYLDGYENTSNYRGAFPPILDNEAEYRVTVKKIRCLRVDDPGNEVEIFGNIQTRALSNNTPISDNIPLFSRSSNRLIDLHKRESFTVNGMHTFTIDKNLMDNGNIRFEIIINLYEHDFFSANEAFIFSDQWTLDDGFNKRKKVRHNTGGTILEVSWMVQKL